MRAPLSAVALDTFVEVWVRDNPSCSRSVLPHPRVRQLMACGTPHAVTAYQRLGKLLGLVDGATKTRNGHMLGAPAVPLAALTVASVLLISDST